MSDAEPTKQADVVSRDEFEKAQARAHKFEAMVADYEKRFKGVDIDALRAKAEEADILRRQAAVGDEKKIDELIAQKEAEIRKGIQSKLEEYESRVSSLSARNKELEVVDKVFAQAADKFNSDCHEDVKARIRSSCDLSEDGQIYIKGDDGKPVYSKAKPSEKMSVNEFIDLLVEQKPSWAKAKVSPGAKAPMFKTGNATNGATIDLDAYSKMTLADKMKLPAKLRGELAKQILKSS